MIFFKFRDKDCRVVHRGICEDTGFPAEGSTDCDRKIAKKEFQVGFSFIFLTAGINFAQSTARMAKTLRVYFVVLNIKNRQRIFNIPAFKPVALFAVLFRDNLDLLIFPAIGNTVAFIVVFAHEPVTVLAP